MTILELLKKNISVKVILILLRVVLQSIRNIELNSTKIINFVPC